MGTICVFQRHQGGVPSRGFLAERPRTPRLMLVANMTGDMNILHAIKLDIMTSMTRGASYEVGELLGS